MGKIRVIGEGKTMRFDIANKVLETTNYDVFKYKRDNRKIKENQKLKEEIKSLGILVPILVNEKYEVIDGQHRLEIARKLKKKVPFIVIKGAGKKEIISINTTSRQWNIEDFINSYAEEGIEEYKRMQVLIRDYNVLVSTLCGLAFNSTDTNGPLVKVRSGLLKFVNYDFLVSFLDFYQELIDKTVLVNNSSLPKSLYTLYRLKKFEPNRIFDKSGLIADKLRGITAQGVTTQVVLDCYNMRLRSGSDSEIKYHKNARGNVEFFEELKDEIVMYTFEDVGDE